jgi:hypothetical protein
MTWEQKMAASLLAGVVGAGLYKHYRGESIQQAVIPGIVVGVAIGTVWHVSSLSKARENGHFTGPGTLSPPAVALLNTIAQHVDEDDLYETRQLEGVKIMPVSDNPMFVNQDAT